ncbi:UDP-forming cellulose synthase catalytic subunit [Granulicella sibirica]|uniref:Cellulose synthase catalytic subunit [UDP-forming] n=1 Tax=Granulicella sibirica TaxID=2479048 RepID=A0A4Q0T4N4_9BACT|nr:UDP-forming cellulose synthase catalytic subunit [Granulicella sibirica]RXH58695.1 Cellulose synthase catalytic subunit [UDP-forming] [Granulicella sibirica]
MTSYLETQSLPVRAFRLAATCVCLFLLFQLVSLYLSYPKQIVLGGISVLVALVLNRTSKSSHSVTIALMLCSLVATLRYGWWRVHMILDYFSDETNQKISVNAVLMLILLSTEAYTILIMLLGYVQTSAPLKRKPIPLPPDESQWPDVDVLIPTYNEPLSLVRYTALAAINIDYPPEKLHVYVLDDGTREDFKAFCEEADIGYITREKHNHAKAGNINHALTRMESPLVTIFDCDHVPTRSFLQVTVGWFMADKKLAMLQTPHFFYSPDPFERNLLKYKTIPNEGELFYGVIQDGNDLWNATFFCGSCAVIRREALNEVGGIATETVTEDAHTSLRMQKRGWDTAYINLPQAAGLATGSLSAHVGQRIRWARGMVQIFRTDNPMLAKGMKFTQRLCYFNSMLHFLYSVPRLVFLCAPLAYMIFGRTIIPGYWVAILAYAVPHLVISGLTNSRVQGMHRHSFWNEIYETVLAPYILLPTLLALVNPKLGKFNVTDKDSTLEETQFDRRIAAPTAWLLLFNFIGVLAVPYRMFVTDPTHPGTVLSNLFWILFNMVILGVAAAVANEQQQRRVSVRISAKIQVRLRTSEGVEAEGITSDISVGGASVKIAGKTVLAAGTELRVSFPMQTADAEVSGVVVGKYGGNLRVKFERLPLEEQEILTRALYSRADAWLASRGNREEDRPLLSLARIIRLSFTGFHQVIRGLLPRKKTTPVVASRAAATVSALVLFWVLTASSVVAQIPGAAKLVQPQTATAATQAAGTPPPEIASLTEDTATDRITLKDMGVQSSIEMHGPHSYYSVGFVLPNSRIPKRGQLNLTYHFSSSILPHAGLIKVMLNNTAIGQIPAPEHPQRDGEYGFVTFPIPAELLIRNNDVTFEFAGGTILQLESTAKSIVLANIGASSTVLVQGDQVAVRRDLSLLPLPLFDGDLQTTTTIPFVFLGPPTPKTLQAAGVIASWLGILASSKPVHFSVSIGSAPRGNVIVFANKTSELPAGLEVSAGAGTLNIKPNPSDPAGSALVLAGDNDDQVLTVARSLSLMTVQHAQPGVTIPPLGDTLRITDFNMPAVRKPDDAPRWLSTNGLRSLWMENSAEAMKSNGEKQIPIYFRLPPDLYYGETQNVNLRLSYRYNAVPVAEGSMLRMYLNGFLIHEAPLALGKDFADHRRTVLVPTERLRPFANTMLVNFDFVEGASGGDDKDPARELEGDILRDSALDIRGLAHWAAMPNLELFANAGFPFTRLADLSDTTVVMPPTPSAKEITLLLYLMSHFGTQTGYPALRAEIAGPDAVMRGDRDYLILGNVTSQPAFGSLNAALPVTLDGQGVHVKQAASKLDWFAGIWKQINGEAAQGETPSNVHGVPDAMIEGIQSPYFAGRSIVVVAMRSDEAVDNFADAFLERSQSSDISQTVSLLRRERFGSYAVATPAYHVGNISNYALMRIWLAQYFWVLLIVVTAFSLLLASWTRDYLAHVAAVRLQAADRPLVSAEV